MQNSNFEIFTRKKCLRFLNKEQYRESKSINHGVRKYDSQTGRFTSTEPLYEKYFGWSPYQYSLNNPVNAVDKNGLWVKEISNSKHIYSGNIQRNSNGYLAQKINYEFYQNWQKKAPSVAEFVQKNNLFVMQNKLGENVYGQGQFGGKLSEYDLSKDNALDLLEGTVLHEIVHNMGYGEFGAWSAALAAGYEVEDQIRAFITSGDPGKQGYIFDGNDQKCNETWSKYINKEISIDNIISIMLEYGKSIIK